MSMSEFPDYVERLGSQALPALVTGIRRGVQHARMLVVDASKRTAFNTGEYARGWKVTDVDQGAMLHNVTVQGSIIEHGRRRGAKQPPSTTLALWAQRKGLSPVFAAERRRVVMGRGRPSMALRRGQDVAYEWRGLGFVIARAIGRRGLPAKNVLAGMLPEITRGVRVEATSQLRETIARLR
jgi:hypothetical protein